MAYKVNYLIKGNTTIVGVAPQISNGVIRGTVELLTTNATTTPIVTIPIVTIAPSIVKPYIQLLAIQSDASKIATNSGAQNGITAEYNGSSVSFVNGSAGVLGITTSGSFGVTWRVDISGNDMVYSVTGLAATNIRWVATYEYFTVTTS